MIFDVAVIGGGVVGACVAREVSSKGLKVALIERGEFGQATSANSLQILHGGLRYLKRLDLYHAYHYVKEQRAWVEASPTLIRPLRCEVALGSKFNWRHAVYFCGLQFYNLLCWNRNRGFSANKKLPSAGLTRSGVAYWYDLQMTDPVALVRTITEQAGRQGALLIKRREVTDGSVDGQTRSLVCRDRETGAQDEVRASVVVTAVGPATNRILRTFGAPPSRVHWIQGINALFDLPAGPSALARKGKSGRMFLLTPLGNQTLVGTGQFPLHTDPENWRAEALDPEAFLSELQQIFPRLKGLTPVQLYRGLIPTHASSTPLQRDVLLDHAHDHRLIALIACKFTSARWLAERATDAVLKAL